MARIEGWKMFLGFLGAYEIIQIVGNYVNSVELKQGQGTSLIVLGIIIYLLFKKYNVKQ